MDGSVTQILSGLYELERARLLALAKADTPQGEYARPVFSFGNAHAKLMLIGEAPGAEETEAGRPFVGKAGRQLDELLTISGISRDELFITNAVKYRPVVRGEKRSKNRTPKQDEVLSALPLLRSEILAVRPKIIATLGNTPLAAVLRIAACKAAVIGSVHGAPMPIFAGDAHFDLFPLFHPASGIYNPSLISVMEADARKLGEHLVKAAELLENR